ncbi:hypothetical protein KC669_04115 [Candidatus Dojkabacteria bacterium]|uniref:Thioredoxin domain-containing protein n=1 Tax=Candidatus Dojkabacteria bacterium TaxID=2099670 RepID=A0A955RLX8_9BACT|nr:hypothetical protein [Candidatus Dojkabacteria bacterium]
MKRIFRIFILFIFAFFLNFANASEIHAESDSNNIEIMFFWGDGCPHCKKAKPFLESILKNYDGVSYTDYEVYNNSENAIKLQEVAIEFGLSHLGVPLTIINDKVIVGYNSDETTGQEIIRTIEQELDSQQINPDNENTNNEESEKISVPVLGEIEPKNVSLPILAIVLGIVDGFNPCAMWILIFLISMLISVENRKKLIILGTTFIATSGFVYFLFMIAWLNFFLFVGAITWIRTLIGFLAIIFAIYSFYKFNKERKGGCVTVSKEKRKNIFSKITTIIKEYNLPLAILGMMILAVSVNFIEILCSAGLPAIFTHVLSLQDLSPVYYIFLMLLYVFFFMIDDLFIFLVAIFTLEITGIQNKYTSISRIIGGVIMLIIGLLLIFSPGTLLMG